MDQYKSLDFFKIIAAILVVAIHTRFLSDTWMGYYFCCFCRIAVPFFFVCSSFLFWKKKGSIINYSRRILLLYLVWLVIFIPYIINTFFLNGQSVTTNILFFIHGLVFHNTFHASWYLMSSVIAMNLVYYLSKRLSNEVLLLVGVFFYFFSLLSCSYYGVVSLLNIELWYSRFDRLFVPSNSFFVAFIYIVIGKIIAEKRVILNIKSSILASLFVLMLGGIEVYQCKGFTRLTDAFIFLPLFVYFFFQFLLCYKICVRDTLCLVFRRLSIVVYLCHYFFIDYHIAHGMELGSKMFLIVATEAVFFALVIVLLSQKIKLLRYLY